MLWSWLPSLVLFRWVYCETLTASLLFVQLQLVSTFAWFWRYDFCMSFWWTCCSSKLIFKIMAESTERISIGDWYDHVDYWNLSGVLQCLPIFSMALSCQMLVYTFLLTNTILKLKIFSTGNCLKYLKMFQISRSTKWTST